MPMKTQPAPLNGDPGQRVRGEGRQRQREQHRRDRDDDGVDEVAGQLAGAGRLAEQHLVVVLQGEARVREEGPPAAGADLSAGRKEEMNSPAVGMVHSSAMIERGGEAAAR
jgi:hypothetical protein